MGIVSEFIFNLKSFTSNVRKFMFCVFVSGLVMASVNIMLGIYYKNIGLTEDIIGSLLSLRTIGSSIGALFAIFLVQWLGTKKTLFLSFGLTIVSGLCFVNITYLPVMQVSSLLYGIAQIVFTVVQAPFYKKNSSDANVVATFSTSFVVQNLAMFVGSLLFGRLSDFFAVFKDAAFGNRTTLNLSFILMLAAIVVTAYIDFGTEEKSSVSRFTSLKEYRRILTKDVWLYLTKLALIGAGAGLVVPFFSMYIKFSLNVSDSVVGAIMAFAQFGTVLGGLIVPMLSKRIGRVNMVLICQLLSIPFLFSISFTQGVILMAISFFFRNALMNMANPILQSMAMDLVEEKDRTVMSSIFSLTDNLFRAGGSFMGGYFMKSVSYNFPYYITMVLYLLSTVVIYFVFGRNEKYKYLR